MPTIVIEGYRFRYYFSDAHEPPHVHILHGTKSAKISLRPVSLEYNHGYSQPALSRILKLTHQNQGRLLEAWNEYFGR